MAPELKKRTASSEPRRSQRLTAKATSDKASPKVKRKAADDASPVSLKKQKSAKQTSTSTEGKSAGKPSKTDKSKKPTKRAVTEKKEAAVAPAEESSDSEEEGRDDMLLLADELDSGEEEESSSKAALFKPGQDVGKIPAISGVKETAKPSSGKRGVVYIGRIPHGFYEYEMRQYLSQFGPVTRIRLSRNKKTGASKHFAFVEFEDQSTAEIVAKTMDNYLLFGHILKVKLVPESQIHEELFKGANRRFKKVPWNKMAGRKLAKPRTETAWESRVQKERTNRAKRADKLKAIGYEFEAPDLKDVPPAVPSEVKAIEPAPSGEEHEGEAAVIEVREATVKEPEPAAETTPAPKPKATKAKTSKTAKAKRAKA